MSTSPAERYAQSRRRRAQDGPALVEFQALYDFTFDDYQRRACHALNDGHGVLVAAPTGSGKTVVGEFAVHLALAAGRKCFYTTPIKALSNQKFGDLARRYGPDKVGLLTGDNSINGEAPVVVMTTEVLRNMLYGGSVTLDGLGYVVLDEVHYLADRFRGAVWEEVIIHLPESVRVVALSATVSNAEEFGEWLTQVRGGTTVIVDEHRPVPLWQHVLADGHLYDLFVSANGDTPQVNPDLLRLWRRGEQARRKAPGRPVRGGRRPVRPRPPSRPLIIERLDAAGLLPAITFIFSRAGCDAAVRQCLDAGLRLTTPEEAELIAEVAQRRTADLPRADLDVLGYAEWLTGLQRGIAAHHAGLLPTFKEVVEELFEAGLVRAVYATETLALGINMPARTVVIERLDKWNGENHAALTPGEYTQLTGRAGRRGIDVEGHAVVLWQPDVEPAALAGLAGTRTYPLNSSFRPSYNMAVNLAGQAGMKRATAILESSFAQFQADRAVAGVARAAQRGRRELDELTVTCDRGDFAGYFRLRRELSELEGDAARQRAASQRAAAIASLGQLRRGDIIRVPGGRRAGMAVVLEPGGGAPGRRADSPPAAAGADGRASGAAAVGGRLPDAGDAHRPGADPELVQPTFPQAPQGPGRQHDDQAGRPGQGATAAEQGAPGSGPGPDRGAGPPGPQPPLPRLPGPGGARPSPGAPRAAAARGGPAGGHRRWPVPRHRPDLPAGLRGARAPRVYPERPGDRRGQAARLPLRRTRPARGGMPAPGAVGRAEPGRTRGVRVGAHLRVALGRGRGGGATAQRAGP